MYKTQKYKFEPEKYKETLKPLLEEIRNLKDWDNESLRQIQSKYPKAKKYMFSKNDLIRGYRFLVKTGQINSSKTILGRIKMKPIRTMSGVAPVTVLTKPWPCPGNCIYCPNEPDMPKSYLESEPGAQRAAALKFDPYLQVQRRIQALQNIGHNTEKVELIVLGGSWSSYPKNYQRWFIKRCFDALNDPTEETPKTEEAETSWENLNKQQKINESAKHKCIGLSLETRPDLINQEEIVRMRRLGCTKVQIGVQSLNDKILAKNLRGHTAKETREAFELLRLAGFKIHAHWMVNLYGATPQKDLKDFEKFWTKNFRPDELKIYPTAIIENTQLNELYKQEKYKPYPEKKLIDLLAKMKLSVPPYCRITRVIRDIPSQEILAGNKKTNLRQIVQNHMEKQGKKCRCIRCREIRSKKIAEEKLVLKVDEYNTSISTEYFISFTTEKNKIAGFLRLSIPTKKDRENHFIEELVNSAIIREVHVYGQVVGIGKEEEGKAQHLGLGKRLIKKAEEIAKEKGVDKIAVISAIGTRNYYRKRGFTLESLYMGKKL